MPLPVPALYRLSALLEGSITADPAKRRRQAHDAGERYR
jgi:hypothetical protein